MNPRVVFKVLAVDSEISYFQGGRKLWILLLDMASQTFFLLLLLFVLYTENFAEEPFLSN